MRIESDYTSWSLMKRRNDACVQEGFEQTLHKTNQDEERRGKLVTVREDGCLRQYIVRPDGSKILLSETHQTEEDEVVKTSRLLSWPQADGVSLNTQDALDLLSLQAGAVVAQVITYPRLAQGNGKKT